MKSGDTKLRVKVVFVFIATIALFVCAEIFFRSIAHFFDPRVEVKLKIKNQLAREVPGEYLIFVYGESSVFGSPVPELGFVKQLQFLVEEHYPEKKIRVVNLGTAGIGTLSLLASIEDTLKYKPDLIVLMTGHNEFLSRFADKQSSFYKIARHSAMARTVGYVLTRFLWKIFREHWANPEEIEVFDQNSSIYREKIAAFKENVQSIVQVIKDHKIPFVLMNSPLNLLEWPPVYKRLKGKNYPENYESACAEILKKIEAGAGFNEVKTYIPLLESFGNDAMASYLLGRIAFLRGEFSKAKTLLWSAKTTDPLPRSSTPEIYEYLQSLATKESLHFVDLVKAFEEASPHGIPGFSLVVDNVHPSPEGNALIARKLFRYLVDLKIFPERHLRLDDCCKLESFLDSFDTELRNRFLMRAATKNGVYSLKGPWFNYGAGRKYFNLALSYSPTYWVPWANLASISFLEGDRVRGLRELSEARRIKGEALDLDDDQNLYLAEGLKKVGLSSDVLK